MAAEGGSTREMTEALRERAAEALPEAEPDGDRLGAGTPAAERVAAALAPLEGEHCRVLHDRLLYPRQSRINLDHIVVSVGGNYLLYAKDWPGLVTVEEGCLRQRIPSGGHWLLDSKLDHVRRIAAQMESGVSSVIEPVLCLTGEEAAAFGEPKTVRGVYVVPIGQLAQWLLARPRKPGVADLTAELTRMATCFPAATDPAFAPIAPALQRPRSSRPAPARSKPAPPKHGASRPGRIARFRRPAGVLLCVALVLSMISGPGQRLWRSWADAAGDLFATRIGSTTTPAAKTLPAAPCSAVTDAVVADAVGHKVYRYLNGAHDVCTWGFVPRPSPTAPGAIRIATGWTAKHGGYPTAATARFSQTATSQVLTVPQAAAVPGSAAAPALITQPVVVVVTWRSSPVTSARARKAIAVLAGEVAKHLPTGSGATRIVRR